MSHNIISEKDKVKMVNYIWEYEDSLSKTFGCYNIKDKKLASFLSSNKIFLGKLNKEDRKKSIKCSFYILYKQDKPKKKTNDEVYHLLRHLRNCFAHGHIKKKGHNKFLLSDYNEQIQTMEGVIDYKDLFTLIDYLKQAKR